VAWLIAERAPIALFADIIVGLEAIAGELEEGAALTFCPRFCRLTPPRHFLSCETTSGFEGSQCSSFDVCFVQLKRGGWRG
jgi:hypothetical protein